MHASIGLTRRQRLSFVENGYCLSKVAIFD
jgi:hypothetical protein